MRLDCRAVVRAFGLVFLLVATAAADPTPAATPTPARVVYPGGLDWRFGAAGYAAAPEVGDVIWRDVAVQPDGKIVVVGNPGWSSFGGIVVARYTAVGELDPSFADDGVFTTAVAAGGFANAVALTDGGEIVVAGSAYRGSFPAPVDPFVLRLQADGSLDPAFAGGIVTVDVGGDANLPDVGAQPSGRVVVLTEANQLRPAAPAGAAVLFGLRTNGKLDSTFGAGGFARITGSAAERFELPSLVQEPDGDLLVAVTASIDDPERTESRVRITRFDRNGRSPRSFASLAGMVTGLGVLADGKVIASGGFADARNFSGNFTRFDTNGAIDAGFGDQGLLSGPEDSYGPIAVDSQNRFLVVGNVLARHYSDGVIDESFGSGGFAAESLRSAFHSVALQEDGKILAAGGVCFSNPKAGSGCFTTLARYESDRTQLCGDADASGSFTVTDGVAVLRAAAGLDAGCDPNVCDVDGSGEVGVTDGVNVLRAAAGLSATLGCGIP